MTPDWECRGGRKRVAGLVYAAKRPGIAQRLQWRAAAQAAQSCPELALQLRDLDAAILWEGLKRPAEDGKWAGAEIVGRRPAPRGVGWHYLLRGGPPDLPEVTFFPEKSSIWNKLVCI